MRLYEARQGDRHLLCSDGLSTVVPTEEIHRMLSDVREPGQAAREFITLANGSGNLDIDSCVVAGAMGLHQWERATCTSSRTRPAPKSSSAKPTNTDSSNKPEEPSRASSHGGQHISTGFTAPADLAPRMNHQAACGRAGHRPPTCPTQP
jgi:serine/threonine protein phosphatase PrpC